MTLRNPAGGGGPNRLLSITSGVGGGAAAPPFSNLLFVDGTTAVPEADRDGSAGAPFSTVTAGIAALAALPGAVSCVLQVTPGDYSAEAEVNWTTATDGALTIVGVRELVQLPEINVAGGVFRLVDADCASVVVSSLGRLEARGCSLPSVVSRGLELTECSGLNHLASSTTSITIFDSTFEEVEELLPVATFLASPGELRLDVRSHFEFLEAGGTVVNGTIVLLAAELPAVAAAQAAADAAQSTANAALANAATALTAANEADDTADAAQATGTSALSAVTGTVPATGTENVSVDVIPRTQVQGTLATGTSVDFDVPMAVGKRCSISADVWVDDGADGVCLMTKALYTVAHRTAGAAVKRVEQTIHDYVATPGHFTFTSAASGTNIRYTLANASGVTRSYNVVIGLVVLDKP